jgi:thymidylate synthase ThyX
MGLNQIKVELCSFWGGDRNAAEAAWASSFDKAKAEARNDDDVRRVVTGLVNLHHDTPKERLWMEFFVTCPIFVERQLDKYRMTVQYQDFRVEYLEAPFGRDGITQNELSGRYRTIPDRPYGLPKDIAEIYSRATGVWVHLPDQVEAEWALQLERQHKTYQKDLERLKEGEKNGLITNAEYKRAREVLRGQLGTAFLTDMRMVFNMNAFEHIINQRLAPEAQMESRAVAYQMVKLAQDTQVAPAMLTAMIEANGWAPYLVEVENAMKADV